jgi:3-deoxy-manno-octulosonate cytidylyltransferase (CMP-KDO synthetase)
VLAESGHALYFSRSAIPFPRDREGWWAAASNELFLLHMGVYAYRRTFLLEYAAWPPTTLERVEKLEQLRAVQRGRRIFVLTVERATHGIDTPEQYQAFVTRYRGRQ